MIAGVVRGRADADGPADEPLRCGQWRARPFVVRVNDVGGQIVKLRTDHRPEVREGDSVHVAFAAFHLFERDSGARRGE